MSRSSAVSTGELDPPGNQSFTRAAVRRPAGEVVDDLARGDAELDLVVAGSLDVARDGHELGAGRGLGADLRVLGAAHVDDVRARSPASRRC